MILYPVLTFSLLTNSLCILLLPKKITSYRTQTYTLFKILVPKTNVANQLHQTGNTVLHTT